MCATLPTNRRPDETSLRFAGQDQSLGFDLASDLSSVEPYRSADFAESVSAKRQAELRWNHEIFRDPDRLQGESAGRDPKHRLSF